MNTQELRIGNYALINGNPEKVTGVILYGLYFYFGYCPNNDQLIKPIEITEKWLLNFGFEKEDENSFLSFKTKSNYRMRIKKVISGEYEYFIWQYSPYSELKIRYVHRLQNLFFIITGEELKID